MADEHEAELDSAPREESRVCLTEEDRLSPTARVALTAPRPLGQSAIHCKPVLGPGATTAPLHRLLGGHTAREGQLPGQPGGRDTKWGAGVTAGGQEAMLRPRTEERPGRDLLGGLPKHAGRGVRSFDFSKAEVLQQREAWFKWITI